MAGRGYFCPLTNLHLVSNPYYGYGSYSRSHSRARARARAAPEWEKRWQRGIVYLLPALLIFLTIIVSGCYFQTTDDTTLTLLVQGLITSRPVDSPHLGLHGVGYLLTALYKWYPKAPWYGIVLYSALYLALVLNVSLLHRLGRRILSNAQLASVITGLYLMAWAYPVFWFTYTCVALLLAAGAFLAYVFDAKEAGPRHIRQATLYTFSYLLALCISPSAALLGVLLTLPGAVRVSAARTLDFKNLVSSVVPFVLVSVVFFSATVLTRSEQEVGFDRLVERYFDLNRYKLYQFRSQGLNDPPITARTYAVKDAIRTALLGDRLAVNESFFARSGDIDWYQFVRKALREKLRDLAGRTIGSYFLMLVTNAALVAYCYFKLHSPTRRRLLLAMQVWVLLLVLFIGSVWRLTELAGAILALHTMVNLTFMLRHRRFRRPKVPVWAWALFGILFTTHLVRASARAFKLAAEQNKNELYLDSLDQRFHGQLLVGVAFEQYFSSLSPWEKYQFKQNRLLLLTGWPTMAPEFRDYLQDLTGKTEFSQAMEALTARPKTVWIAPIGFEGRFNRLMRTVHNTHVTLLSFAPYVPGPAYDELNEYYVGVPKGRLTPVGAFPGTLRAPKVARPTEVQLEMREDPLAPPAPGQAQ